MIVTCPSCTTRYFAEDHAIGSHGRNVRCASCGHSWFVEPQLVLDQAAPEDLLPQAAPLTRDQVERLRRQHQERGGRPADGRSATAKIRERQLDRRRAERLRTAAAAWVGAGATLAVSAAGAVVFREDVAQAWPQAASAYAALGLPVNVYGLEFADLEIERSYDGATPVLVVTGVIRNIGGEAKLAPPLRFALRDEAAQEIFRWVLRLDGQEIPAGGSLPFETLIDNPPIQAEDLEATFASAREALEAGPPMPPAQEPLVAPRGFSDEPLALRDDAALPDIESGLMEDSPPLRAGPIDPPSAPAPGPEPAQG